MVTGADGFIGSNLIQLLKETRQCRVKHLDRHKHHLILPASLAPLLHGADVVIHLAGENRGSKLTLFKGNALATLGLLEGISSYCPGTKLIFASSILAYSPESYYGLTKRVAEQLVKQYSGVSVRGVVLRLSNVYGPLGRPHYNSVIATFAHMIRTRREFVIHGNGTQTRDYLFVRDAVNAIIKAMDYEPKSGFETFDICSGKKTSLNTIVHTLESVVGHKVAFRYEGRGDTVGLKVHLDCGRARKTLKWRPETSLGEGLRAVMSAT